MVRRCLLGLHSNITGYLLVLDDFSESDEEEKQEFKAVCGLLNEVTCFAASSEK